MRRPELNNVISTMLASQPEVSDLLFTVGCPPQVESYGEQFLAAVRRGRAVPEDDRPFIHVPSEDSAEVKRLGELLWVAAQTICLGQSVTTALVTSQSEVLALARLVHKKRSLDKHPLMHGWHRKCLGDKLLAFAKGELKIDLLVQESTLRANFSEHH